MYSSNVPVLTCYGRNHCRRILCNRLRIQVSICYLHGACGELRCFCLCLQECVEHSLATLTVLPPCHSTKFTRALLSSFKLRLIASVGPVAERIRAQQMRNNDTAAALLAVRCCALLSGTAGRVKFVAQLLLFQAASALVVRC